MSVTVVLPVFNAAKTLRQSVESILHQTHQEFELIVVDDCSTDGSLKLIKELQSNDSRIRVISNNSNIGVVQTLNRAIAEARYDLIARMDADDESHPERIRLQYEMILSSPRIALVGSSYKFMGRTPRRDIQVLLPSSPSEIRARILLENPICHPSVMFKREVFDEFGGYREFFKNAEDYDLWLRFSSRYDLVNIAEPLVRYRLSVGGVTLMRRWEMYVFHHLAIESFKRPDIELSALKQEVESTLEREANKEILLQSLYSSLMRDLWRLGHKYDAIRVWWRMKTASHY